MNGPRSAVVWAIRYGLPGLAIRAAARRGDLIARATVDPDVLDDPTSIYDELLERGPVVGGRLVGASAHHDVVNQVLRDETFLAEPAGAPTKLLGRVLAAAVDPRAAGPVDAPSLLAIQPPQHGRIRKLIAPSFTVRAIGAWAPRIRAVADELLDRIESRRAGFDLVTDYAALLPVTVIAEIIGLPVDMREDFLRIGNDAARTLDPALSWADFRAADRAIREGNAWLDEHIATLRKAPGDDLLSELIRVNEDGDRLSDEELRVNTLLLLGAGFETTVNLIGNAVALLLEHPAQLAGLRVDPGGWENAVDEALRYDSPVQVTVRTAREATEVAGQPVRAGYPLILMLGAANRDPAVFTEPHRFDVTRPNARQHLAFSAGAHYCLGAQLARQEAVIALQALFERYPDVAVAGRPLRRSSRVLRGYEHFPLAAPNVGVSRATA